MSVEITRGKSSKVFRINPYNARVIDWRFSYRGARWQYLESFVDAAAARAALLELEKGAQDE